MGKALFSALVSNMHSDGIVIQARFDHSGDDYWWSADSDEGVDNRQIRWFR
jgi:hypothetical protein